MEWIGQFQWVVLSCLGGTLMLFLDLHQFIQVIPNEMICDKWEAVKRDFVLLASLDPP